MCNFYNEKVVKIDLKLKWDRLRDERNCLFWQTRHDRQLCYLRMYMISVDVEFVFVYHVTHEAYNYADLFYK